jgi:hypothetical protein
MLSGFVHYTWGDSEVVMIFYVIMGLSLVVERSVGTGSGLGSPRGQPAWGRGSDRS